MKLLAFLLDLLLKPVVWYYHKSRTISIYLKARLPRGAKVLDIGSGSNPWFRSNVLFEKYPDDDTERGGRLVRDGREIVFGDAEKLPFPDKHFDFVYCSHVAEHVENIGLFFQEIQRVGKAGYIETPNYIFEQAIGTTTHSWALFVEGHVLHAEKKWMAGAPSKTYRAMHHLLARHPLFAFCFIGIEELAVMRFWWKNRFDYAIHPAPSPLEETCAKPEAGSLKADF